MATGEPEQAPCHCLQPHSSALPRERHGRISLSSHTSLCGGRLGTNARASPPFPLIHQHHHPQRSQHVQLADRCSGVAGFTTQRSRLARSFPTRGFFHGPLAKKRMVQFCQYKDLLGKSGTGLHSIRLFNVAVVDVATTVALAWLFTKIVPIPFWFSLVFWLVMGIFLHQLFCVRTTINSALFPPTNPH